MDRCLNGRLEGQWQGIELIWTRIDGVELAGGGIQCT